MIGTSHTQSLWKATKHIVQITLWTEIKIGKKGYDKCVQNHERHGEGENRSFSAQELGDQLYLQVSSQKVQHKRRQGASCGM